MINEVNDRPPLMPEPEAVAADHIMNQVEVPALVAGYAGPVVIAGAVEAAPEMCTAGKKVLQSRALKQGMCALGFCASTLQGETLDDIANMLQNKTEISTGSELARPQNTSIPK